MELRTSAGGVDHRCLDHQCVSLLCLGARAQAVGVVEPPPSSTELTVFGVRVYDDLRSVQYRALDIEILLVVSILQARNQP